MTGLPLPLAPWAAELAGFPPVVASVLGPWLPVLERMVGPLAAPSMRGQGEPDGYGDLSRRGSYERLVTSEWLLASDAPEEFLRRAAQSEHLFLGRKLQSQTGGVRTVVLFDSGPEQLGAPRLVHLALLIVLARRARTAAAAFGWAPLQRPGHAMDQESDAHAGQRLLSRRCLDVTTGAQAANWAEMLKSDLATESWVVTGPQGREAVGPGPRRWGCVTVSEPLSLQRTHLEVEVRPPNGGSRTLRLPLPAPDEQVRLLRDPWNSASSAGMVRHGPLIQRHALMFLPGSHRLVVRLANGEILIHDVPNVRSNPGGSPRYVLPPGQGLLAAGAYKRRFALVTFGDGRIELVTGSRSGRVTARLDVPDVSCDDLCRPLLPVRMGYFPQSVVFGDARGVLRFWDIPEGRMKPLLLKSLAYTWLGGASLPSVNFRAVTRGCSKWNPIRASAYSPGRASGRRTTTWCTSPSAGRAAERAVRPRLRPRRRATRGGSSQGQSSLVRTCSPRSGCA